jgi:hypothetical protein
MAVDPNNPDIVFLSMIDLFRSTNGADQFTNLTCGYSGGDDVHVDHHARVYVGGTSTTMLVGSDGGIYLTTNANTGGTPTFTQLNDTVSAIEFYSGDITANFAFSEQPGINAGAQDNGSSVYVWSGDPGPAMWPPPPARSEPRSTPRAAGAPIGKASSSPTRSTRTARGRPSART